MCVISAEKDIKARIARKPEQFLQAVRPKYLRHSILGDLEESLPFSPTAACTLSDEPLPRPSPEEFLNSDAITTISDNPELFRIITPINVNKFE